MARLAAKQGLREAGRSTGAAAARRNRPQDRVTKATVRAGMQGKDRELSQA